MGFRRATRTVHRRPHARFARTAPSRKGGRTLFTIRGRPLKTKLRTKTKTKRKLNQRVSTENGGPISQSMFHYPKLRGSFQLGKFKKMTAPQFYVVNQTMRLDVPIGKQGILGLNSAGGRVATGCPQIYHASDIVNMFINAKSLVDTPANVLNPKTQKLYMDGVNFELLMTNQTNDVAHVQLFCVTSRRDIGQNDADQTQYETAPDAWVKGNIDEGNINAWNIVGSNPFQAPGFGEMWRVDKILDVNLHSGGHHKHVVTFNPHKMFSNELTTAFPLGVFKDWTKNIFAVCHGYAINDSTTKTQISTSAVSIDFIWRKQYEYHLCERSTTQLYTVNSLPTAFTVAGEFVTDATTVLANTLLA